MAFGQPVDFNYFLQRKYALLQQQADAGTSQAASGAVTAAAQANNLNADAALTGVRAKLLPGESAATIGLQGAQRNLLTEQAAVVRPESTARIGQIGAETAYTTSQNQNYRRVNLTGINGGAAGVPVAPAALGPGGYTGFRLSNGQPGISTTKPARLPGESAVAYMDRTGWGL